MSEPIITKTCRVCKETKPFSEFYIHSHMKEGRLGKCKTCCTKQQKKHRDTKQGRAAIKRYRQSDKGKAAHIYSQKCYNIRNPNQFEAHKTVSNAVRTGKLSRSNIKQCHYCFKQAQEYHHPSYALENQLDVIPVCIKCHNKLHRKQQIA